MYIINDTFVGALFDILLWNIFRIKTIDVYVTENIKYI